MALIDLTNDVAFVTGGSRGVGAATARMLARAGAAVGIGYRTRADDAEAVVRTITEAGGTARAYQGDLADPETCREVVERVASDFGRLDVYVANAGVWPPEDVAVRDLPAERWRHTLAVNLDAVFFGTQAAMRVMGSGGRVVIVSSTAGQRGEAYHADYAATKGAVIAYVKSLAVEAAPDITVNAIAPGWIDTEMCDLPYGADDGEGRKRIEAGIPLGRVATAEDTAGPIVFLCSRLARHVTGEILNVNGGSVLCG